MATHHGRAPAVLLCLLAAAAASGCGRESRPPATSALAVTDDAGRAVHLARPARRVVSLVPSINETLLALGARSRIIARSDYDRAPELAALPSVGGGLTPNIEWLAARRPELVLAWPDERSRAVVGRLEALGIPVYAARVETLADADRTTRNLGLLLGMRATADSLNRALQARLDAVRQRAAGQPQPRVLYLIGMDPPEVAAGGTFVDQLLRLAGGRNVFADLKLWPNVGLEEIVRRDADVLVLAVYGETAPATDAVQRLRATPGWSALRAVRAGRVAALDPDLMNRPGPRAGEAAERLYAVLHPGAAAQAPGRVQADTATRRHGDTASRATSPAAGAEAARASDAPPVAGRRPVAASPRRRVAASAGRRP